MLIMRAEVINFPSSFIIHFPPKVWLWVVFYLSLPGPLPYSISNPPTTISHTGQFHIFAVLNYDTRDDPNDDLNRQFTE